MLDAIKTQVVGRWWEDVKSLSIYRTSKYFHLPSKGVFNADIDMMEFDLEESYILNKYDKCFLFLVPKPLRVDFAPEDFVEFCLV